MIKQTTIREVTQGMRITEEMVIKTKNSITTNKGKKSIIYCNPIIQGSKQCRLSRQLFRIMMWPNTYQK